MTSRQQAKGDAFERSIVNYFRDEFGAHITRPKSGAEHDRGDIAGIPGWTFELKCYTDPLRAIREGLAELAVEQANTGTRHGLVVVKRRGVTDPAQQLAVMPLGSMVPLIRETWEVPA